MHQDLWKDVSKELPSFINLVHCVVGEGRDLFLGRSLDGGETSLCFIFETVSFVFPKKTTLLLTFLFGLGARVPFRSICHPLSNKETSNVASFLVLLEGHSFRLGRRDVRVWNPNPLEGFFC